MNKENIRNKKKNTTDASDRGSSRATSTIFSVTRRPTSVVTSTPKDKNTSTRKRVSISKQDLVVVRRKNVDTSRLSRPGTTSTTLSAKNYNNNNNISSKRDLNKEKTKQLKSKSVPETNSKTSSLKSARKPTNNNQSNLVNNNNITVRKRDKNKDGHVQQDNLSRTSSITNLDSLEYNNKNNQKSAGAKSKKSTSKERIDKVNEKDKKYDAKKGVTKNNNKLDTGENSYSLDSLQEEEPEILLLRRQLQEMANEKSTLALQLGEQKGQLNSLQKEILKLKEESNMELEKLAEENTILRNRLRDVAHSPLSDTEKQQLIFESQRHHSSSAPASIATNVIDDSGGDHTACTTPEWDKHSSGNISEVSVACLQDKINQMQETHYSTNEELQATLQELTDLQRQLTELQQENERLNEEKTLMFDSLCRQTDRLTESRHEVEDLKHLIYKEENGQYETAVEREQKLVELLKTAQEERENLLMKLDQMNNEVQEARGVNIEKNEGLMQLSDRVRTLECSLDAKNAEHKQLDQELTIIKDQCSGKQIEVNRLSDMLENARTKIIELEQDRTLSDKSELDEMLDNARKEKDQLESEVTFLKEQLARSKNENEKLKEQVFMLQEECKVTRNNAKTTQSDLEYKCERLVLEKNSLSEQLQQFQEALNELQVQTQCHLEDKRQLSAVLSETQRNLSEAERRNQSLENEFQELKKLREDENDEWEKFQNDLLTSVRVANDFKTEAQEELQKFILENKSYREKVRLLETQVEKLKVSSEPVPIRPTSFPTDDITLRRKNVCLSRQNSRQSVKSLIESIESHGKPVTKSTLASLSRSSSASSLNSLASDNRSPASPSIIPTPSPGSPLRTPSDWSEISNNTITQLKTPLKEQQPNKLNRDWTKSVINDSMGKTDISKAKLDDGYRESILQKSIEFSRRNSYSDLSERKDPLNGLVKNGGSKRNALLKWCQNKTVGYRNIDITNFSSSWNDGLALCALLHTYLSDKIAYDSLTPQEKRRNFSLAFSAAESVGIPTTLNINDMVQLERPDWQQVMSYVTAIYRHFET